MRKEIKIAAQCIREGKLVAFPTDTVYGLGANALNPIAVAKIFEAKERPSFDPLIIHIADIKEINQLIKEYDNRILQLAEAFWPGPLTLILPKSNIVPDIVTSGLDTVGIRIPNNDIALDLIRESQCPIAAPSANKFGRISPTKAEHVRKQLIDVDYILDGGPTTIGIESTIIKLTENGFIILRNGIITKEDIELVIPSDNDKLNNNIIAPGMIESHYSPTKEIIIDYDSNFVPVNIENVGLISYTGKLDHKYKHIIQVSQNKDPKEYAVNLFDAMHKFEDDNNIEIIIAEAIEEKGIGLAIMDRLRRAAFQWKQD